MNDETLKLITERFIKLPQEIQVFVGNRSWAERVTTIAQQNNLSEEQTGGLILESALVLIGLAHTEDLAMELKERLSLSSENAAKISGEIAAIIPDTVKKLLDELCAKEAASTPTLASTTPLTPPAAPQTPLAPTPSQPTSMFEEKLKRVFTVPREESRVASTPQAPTAPKTPTPPAVPRPGGSDPYREPLA